MTKSTFFYADSRLVSALAGTDSLKVFRGAGMPLAEQGTDASALLLSIDRSHSTLRAAKVASSRDRSYSPYGHLPLGDTQNLLAYNGERRDLTGLYLLGNGKRAYSPTLMRFVSPDPIGIFPQGNYNAYAYCNGEPINYMDSSGTWRRLISAISRGIQSIKPSTRRRNKLHAKAKKLIIKNVKTSKLIVKLHSQIAQDEKNISNYDALIKTESETLKTDNHQYTPAGEQAKPNNNTALYRSKIEHYERLITTNKVTITFLELDIKQNDIEQMLIFRKLGWFDVENLNIRTEK